MSRVRHGKMNERPAILPYFCDEVERSLTQCESMLVALRSLHSIGSAPIGVRPLNSSTKYVLAPTPHARQNCVHDNRTEE